MHHAHANLAHVTHFFPRDLREPYIRGLTAGALYEARRLHDAGVFVWYYRYLHRTYDMALAVEECERGWTGPKAA